MRKLLAIFFAIILSIFILAPLKASADNEFSTSYQVNYDVSPNGMTQVSEAITLKNLTDKYYASNFVLTIGSTTLTDISASGDSGELEIKSEVKDNKTVITLKFNEQVVGTGRTQTVTLRFKSKDFAENVGKTWQVSLPKISSAATYENYSVILSVPVSFGDPTVIVPTPLSQTQNVDKLIYVFSKDQLINSGVSASFGTTQLFSYQLKYQLENKLIIPILTNITLPPNTKDQDVTIDSIDPKPENVTLDSDGNVLAWYRLTKSQKQEVTVKGKTKLYINHKNNINTPLSANMVAQYTKEDNFWQTGNPIIRTKLSEIFKKGTPSTNKEKANLIYRYVVDNLKYDTSRLSSGDLTRLGAVTVLNNPDSAVCMEFTDLFITLARAAGVPARELDGYAYTKNKTLRPLAYTQDGKAVEFLHAWPEYFDEKKGWVMIDPTWENTTGGVDYFNKFDLNHFVLSIKGVSSETPSTSDDVKVDVTTEDFTPVTKLTAQILVPDILKAGFPETGKLKILNEGNFTAESPNAVIKASKVNILGSKVINLGEIPPFGYNSYDLNLRTSSLWQGFEDNIEVTVATSTGSAKLSKFSKQVRVKPIFTLSEPLIYSAATLLIFGLYGFVLSTHLIKRRKSKN